MFTVTLKQLQLPVKIGWTKEERVAARIVEATIVLQIAAPNVAQSDQLTDTVDYDQIIKLVQNISGQNEWKLLERLSAELTMAIIEINPKVLSVEVSLSKNIYPELKSVTVTHSRSRHEM